MILNLITVPELEPITLQEAKDHLRVDTDDEDGLIGGLITAARELFEQLAEVSLVTRTYRVDLDGFPPCGEIQLPRPPLFAVSQIQYLDGSDALTTLDPSTYRTAGGIPGLVILARGYAWPGYDPRAASVRVTYTAGFGANAADVPERAKAAIKLLLGSWFENREEGQATAKGPVPFGVLSLANSMGAKSY